MANYIATDTDLTAVADAIRAKGGASGTLEFPDEFVSAIGSISNVNNQDKSRSYTPSETAQSETITADSGYTGLGEVSVSVGAIASDYVGSGITRRSSSDLTASGATVTAPAGYYSSSSSKSVTSGTAGTPTATKGTVSSNSVTVTPSVTNTTGYITGGTKTGTAVTVSASELVSGTKTITSSGNTDVTNYATASVAAGSAATPATSITANPTLYVSNSGLVSAAVSKSQNITPTVNAGWVSSGTAGSVSIDGLATQQLSTQAATTYHPSTTDQTIASGKYTTGAQTIKAVTTTNLTAENIVSGVTVKVGDSTDDDCVASVTGTAQGGTLSGLVWQDNEGYIHFDDEGGDMYITTPLSVTSNGTYTAPTGVAYSPVSVQVSSSPTLQAKTNISPTTSSQTITADSGYDGLSSVQINAMPSGSATTPATTVTANPSISVNSSGLITATASATKSVTPTVSAGYVSSGTAGTITVSGSNTSQLTTQAAQTIHPSSSDQTITSGKYLTGTQTIKGVTTTNLSAGNIKSGVTVEIGDSTDSDCVTSVTGTYTGGGGGTSGDKAGYNDVIFFDSNGDILYSYAANEVLSWSDASDMPSLPTHNGLTALSWTHSIQELQTQVTSYGMADVGIRYKTTDEKTRFYITVDDDTKSLRMNLNSIFGGGIVVDWGDNTTPQTVSSVSGVYVCDHTYAQTGSYVIVISAVDSFEQVAIPNGEDSGNNLGSILFQSLPISTTKNSNYKAKGVLRKIEAGGVSLTNSVELIRIGNHGLHNCYNLEEICVNSLSFAGVNQSHYTFYGCRKLKAFASSRPTVNDYTFYQCNSLRFISSRVMYQGTETTGYTFGACYSLYRVAEPMTSRAYMYTTNYQMRTALIPSDTTRIYGYAFQTCSSLEKIVIPATVTTIDNYAFTSIYNCEFHFLSDTPIYLNTYSFGTTTGVSPTGCFYGDVANKIYVPYSVDHSVLEAYQTSWSQYASYIVEESP